MASPLPEAALYGLERKPATLTPRAAPCSRGSPGLKGGLSRRARCARGLSRAQERGKGLHRLILPGQPAPEWVPCEALSPSSNTPTVPVASPAASASPRRFTLLAAPESLVGRTGVGESLRNGCHAKLYLKWAAPGRGGCLPPASSLGRSGSGWDGQQSPAGECSAA